MFVNTNPTRAANMALYVHFVPGQRVIHVPRRVPDKFAAPDLQEAAVQRVSLKLFVLCSFLHIIIHIFVTSIATV